MKDYLLCGFCRCVLGCRTSDERWNCSWCNWVCEFKGVEDPDVADAIPFQGCCDSCREKHLEDFEVN